MRPTFERPAIVSRHQDGRFAVAVTQRFEDGALSLLVQDMMDNTQTAVFLTAEQVATLSTLSREEN